MCQNSMIMRYRYHNSTIMSILFVQLIAVIHWLIEYNSRDIGMEGDARREREGEYILILQHNPVAHWNSWSSYIATSLCWCRLQFDLRKHWNWMAIACCDLVRCAVAGLWQRWTTLSQNSGGGRESAFWLWSSGSLWHFVEHRDHSRCSTSFVLTALDSCQRHVNHDDYLRSQTELTTMRWSRLLDRLWPIYAVFFFPLRK